MKSGLHKRIATKVTLGATGAMLMAGTALAVNPDAQQGIDQAKGNLTDQTLGSQISSITNLMITIIATVSVIMLIIGGFRYVLSGGDQKGTTAAKDTILYAIIGVVVALLAFSIMNYVVGKV